MINARSTTGAGGGAQATPEIPQGGPPEEVAAGCVVCSFLSRLSKKPSC